MALVIEATDESGPCCLPAISVCHYGEQNGDLMRDPEMCFELGFIDGLHLSDFYYRNDYVGVGQWSRTMESSGRPLGRDRRDRSPAHRQYAQKRARENRRM